MEIKAIVDEDFSNYKKPCMLIGFPECSFKCEIESGQECCQNSVLAISKNIELSTMDIIKRYVDNNLTESFVMGGLEPFDTWEDLLLLITHIRQIVDDDIVIYTGYNKEEITDKIKQLIPLKNIIIKYGRYIPNQEKHFDEILGVDLASDNQYAEVIC